jgi:hypothetical protein
MSLSHRHSERPYSEPGEKLGDRQFEQAGAWEASGHLALVGMGVEPGLADVFARYAADHLFSSIEEVGVRDGANLTVDGYEFAPSFSLWTTIEECLNPPIVWEKGRGWYTTPPFSEPETFELPEGIGPVECVNVEHEEVLLVPRWVDAGRMTFKYGLGDEFINVLQVLHAIGLDRTEKVRVGGVEVSPRDVVAACLPDPAELGDRMHGKTCAGTWSRAQGRTAGRARSTSTTSTTMPSAWRSTVCRRGERMARRGPTPRSPPPLGRVRRVRGGGHPLHEFSLLAVGGWVLLLVPWMVRGGRLALSGVLVGFGAPWSLLMWRQLTSQDPGDNALGWTLVGVLPLVLGLALLGLDVATTSDSDARRA